MMERKEENALTNETAPTMPPLPQDYESADYIPYWDKPGKEQKHGDG